MRRYEEQTTSSPDTGELRQDRATECKLFEDGQYLGRVCTGGDVSVETMVGPTFTREREVIL